MDVASSRDVPQTARRPTHNEILKDSFTLRFCGGQFWPCTSDVEVVEAPPYHDRKVGTEIVKFRTLISKNSHFPLDVT